MAAPAAGPAASSASAGASATAGAIAAEPQFQRAVTVQELQYSLVDANNQPIHENVAEHAAALLASSAAASTSSAAPVVAASPAAAAVAEPNGQGASAAAAGVPALSISANGVGTNGNGNGNGNGAPGGPDTGGSRASSLNSDGSGGKRGSGAGSPTAAINPLHRLAVEGSKDDAFIGKTLDAHATALNAPDKHGLTPLMYAAQNGRANFIALTLKRLAPLNPKGGRLAEADVPRHPETGQTALAMAVAAGHAAAVREFVADGTCDFTVADAKGQTPSDLAAALVTAGARDAAEVKSLVAQGVDKTKARRAGKAGDGCDRVCESCVIA